MLSMASLTSSPERPWKLSRKFLVARNILTTFSSAPVAKENLKWWSNIISALWWSVNVELQIKRQSTVFRIEPAFTYSPLQYTEDCSREFVVLQFHAMNSETRKNWQQLHQQMPWMEWDFMWLQLAWMPMRRVGFESHHHHQLNVHFLPRLIKGMDGCFPTALGRPSTFSNILGPLV